MDATDAIETEERDFFKSNENEGKEEEEDNEEEKEWESREKGEVDFIY